MRKSLSRGAARGAALLLVTAGLVPLAILAMGLGEGTRRAIRRSWCKGACWLLGVRLSRKGDGFRGCPTLFVANHVSYLDILALGAFLGGTFIAKAEVAGWPLLGFLSRLDRTFFVRRHWRQALIQRNTLAARMRRGESFVLFGEGTSTDGLAVRKIKTSLLGVADPFVLDRPIAVQAVALTYVRLADGTAITPETCGLYAWYGEATLLPHLWNVLQMRGVEVRVVLHEPALSWSVPNRKVLGRELHDAIARTLATSRGEIPALPPARARRLSGGPLPATDPQR